MMTELETYLQRGQRTFRRWAGDERVRRGASLAAHGLGGFCAAAASLGNAAQPLAMGLLLAFSRWQALAAALGGAAGYAVFWGSAGYQGIVWIGVALVMALIPVREKWDQEAPFLVPALSACAVALAGLLFQVAWGDQTAVPVYLLRVGLAAGSALLFPQARENQTARWIAQGAGVLALAQVMPVPWLGLGYLAAGLIAAGDSFPAAVLAGLGLDLAQVTGAPMTAVLTAAYFIRLIPTDRKWVRYAGVGPVYLLVAALSGSFDLTPLPMLALGSALAAVLPPRPELTHHRGQTGAAQVRLEVMAGVLSQTQQLLMEASPAPIDREALLARTRERACGGCPNRKGCKNVTIPEQMLDQPTGDTIPLPFACRKPGRMLTELQRTREQMRFLQGDRQRRQEYRQAVIQQYQFLGDYLRQTADTLPRRERKPVRRYTPEVAVCSAGKESANGDRCLWFEGTESRYYILLCDGMGTGLGAAQESRETALMLRQMLTAGFPADHALRSVNSLSALRGRAGAATVDLAEISLTTGAVTLYKWGAAPSWLLRREGAEKIGTASPPPGLSVAEGRETVDRLSLRRGEALVVCSDGLAAEGVLHGGAVSPEAPPGELAAYLLERCGEGTGDDATCAVVKLHPAPLST